MKLSVFKTPVLFQMIFAVFAVALLATPTILAAQGIDPAAPTAGSSDAAASSATQRGSGAGHGMMRGSGKGHGMMRGSGKGHGMMCGSGKGHGMMRGSHAALSMMEKGAARRAMMEAHIAYKKSALNITAAQTAQWEAYADLLRKRKTIKMNMRKAMKEAKKTGTPVERMDLRLTNMTAKIEMLKALKSATENLYKALDGDQKKMADVLLR